MAIASFEQLDVYPQEVSDTRASLVSMRSELLGLADRFDGGAHLASTLELSSTVAAIEDLSRVVEYLQILGAHAAERQNIAAVGETDRPIGWALPDVDTAFGSAAKPKRGEFKDAADFLRARLLISRSEARRRLRLAACVVPPVFLSGERGKPVLEHLAAAVAEGDISARAATLVCDSVERSRPSATTPDELRMLNAMEQGLTAQAAESDPEVLNMVARAWESALDPDGREPSEEMLRMRQGIFLRGYRNGLHRLEIAATGEQYECLMTVINTATNPRTQDHSVGGVDGVEGCREGRGSSAISAVAVGLSEKVLPDSLSRAQRLLNGLVAACKVALAADGLPATGGHRPQVMVSIGYQELTGQLAGSGHAVFGGLVSPGTVRRIACDADIIPLILGGQGEVLDVGRAQRLFGPATRRALVARDKGCAFPDCTVPAVWCEAHHIMPWWAGGRTSVENGVLVCAHHHALIEQGNWRIDVVQGIPWFIPPPYLDPDRIPRRNRYRHTDVPVLPHRHHDIVT